MSPLHYVRLGVVSPVGTGGMASRPMGWLRTERERRAGGENIDSQDFRTEEEIIRKALDPSDKHLWRNRLARLAVKRKVAGSSPARCDFLFFIFKTKTFSSKTPHEVVDTFFLIFTCT